MWYWCSVLVIRKIKLIGFREACSCLVCVYKFSLRHIRITFIIKSYARNECALTWSAQIVYNFSHLYYNSCNILVLWDFLDTDVFISHVSDMFVSTIHHFPRYNNTAQLGVMYVSKGKQTNKINISRVPNIVSSFCFGEEVVVFFTLMNMFSSVNGIYFN